MAKYKLEKDLDLLKKSPDLQIIS